VEGVQLGIHEQRMLLGDWFAHLARARGLELAQSGRSDRAITLGPPSEFHVTAHYVENRPFLDFLASDPDRQDLVNAILAKAVARLDSHDFGGVVWYSTELREIEFGLSSSFLGPFLQRLDKQTRIAGWRRLGVHILLEFTEQFPPDGDVKEPALLAPKVILHAHVAVPGPCAGWFSSDVAHGLIEPVSAICSFALGRPLALPWGCFPAEPDLVRDLAERQADGAILTLARKHTSLDISVPSLSPAESSCSRAPVQRC
jgi:hypothetical protein